VQSSLCSTIPLTAFYRLYDFTKAHALEPSSYYCVSGKVNSADKLYLVIESVKPDGKHIRSSIIPCSSGRRGKMMHMA